MKRKLLASLSIPSLLWALMVPMAPAAAAVEPTPGPGYLQLESNLGFRDNAAPGLAGTTEDGIYFFAEDPVYGYELHYWTESGVEVFDATVGAENSSFRMSEPYRGGIAVNLQQTDRSRAITGWHDGERMRWLTKSDVSWLPDPNELAVVGDRIYLARFEFQQPRTLHSLDFGVSGFDLQVHDWQFKTGTDLDGNPIYLAADQVSRYTELRGVGSFLVGAIDFLNRTDEDGLYAVDTSQTQPQWFKLSSKGVDSIAHELESFTVLYLDDSLEKFNVTDTIASPVILGGSSIPGAYSIEISSGELFAYAPPGLFQLVNGTFQSLEYQGQPLNAGLNHIAVIDDVAYLEINQHLGAVELGTELVWDVLQLNGDFSSEGLHFVGAWKKQVVFGARSEMGNNVFLFDTMTDTLRTIHSEEYPTVSMAEGLTKFKDKLYFFASVPNPNLSFGLMVYDGMTVRPVTDSNGRQLGADMDNVSGNPAVVVGNYLFFVAVDTTIDGIGDASDENLRLWRLGPNDEFPTMIPWPSFPAQLRDIRLVGVQDSVVIETENEAEEIRVWVYRSGASEILELQFPNLSPDVTNVRSQTMELGGSSFVAANDQMWIRLGSENQATVESPAKYFSTPARSLEYDTSGPYWDRSFVWETLKVPGLDRYLAIISDISAEELVLAEITLENEELIYTELAILDSQFNDLDLEVVSVAGTQQLFLQADPSGLPGRIFQFPLFDADGNYVFGSTHKGYLDFSRPEILEFEFIGGMVDLVVGNYRYLADLGLIIVTDGDDEVLAAFASQGLSQLYPIGNYLQNGIPDLWVEYSSGMVTLGTKVFFVGRISRENPDALMSLDTSGAGTNLVTEAAVFESGDLYTTKVFPRPAGASHNLTLKANYPEPDPDLIQRANSPTTIDDAGFAREGFELLGWAESSTGTVVYQPAGVFPFSSSDVLYAKWQSTTVIEPEPEPDPNPAPAPAPQPPSSGSSAPSVVSVSFATEVGATALNTLRVSAGSQVVLPKLVKPGHEFLGWSETKNGLLVGEAYRPASSVQLHPVFEPLQFKIFLSLPAGAEGDSSVVFSGDKALSLPTPTLKDHTFVAWVNAETGERITSDWLPTESVMLAPLFKAGTADEVVNFWRNSQWVSATQLRKLTSLVADEALINGRRTIVIRGFDIRNKDLARGRALNVAIKLRKLGVTDKIVLETELGGGANKAEIVVN